MRDILDYFPLAEPRPQQVQALRYVQEVLAKGYRDIALELPTGVGKTAVGATVALWAWDNLALDSQFKPGAYILVQQKVLQDQIEAELDRLGGGETRAALIKASVEYECPMFKRCSVGMVDRRCEFIGVGQCRYKLAKARFLSAHVAVTNYSYFFTERLYVGQVEPRNVLVCDEAHGLTEVVLRMVDIVVSGDRLHQFAPNIPADDLRELRTLEDFLHWMEDDYIPEVSARAEILLALNDSDEAIKEAYEVSQHLMKVEAFVGRATADPHGWVFWQEEGREGAVTLTARPLDAAPYFDQLIATQAPVRIYLSAFPGPKGIFCAELGLEQKRTAWMRQSSPFPVESRPIHLLNVGSMSQMHQAATMSSLLRMVLKIVESHPDERGIIHTHSYRLADAVFAELFQSPFARRIVYPRRAEEREDALKTHAQLPGGVLLSPSMGEGFDFRGDLARWQIVCKCLDAETQILTVAGLKRYYDITSADYVFGITPDGELVEQKVNDVFVRQISGEMININNGAMLLTPDHRVLLRRCHKTVIEYVPASTALARKNHTVPTVPKTWKGEHRTKVSLEQWMLPSDMLTLVTSRYRYPALRVGFLRRNAPGRCWHFSVENLPAARKLGRVRFQGAAQCKRSPIEFDAGQFFELMGWIVSEGWVDGQKQAVRISQTKLRGVRRLKGLLGRLRLHYGYGHGKFTISSRLLARFVSEMLPGKSWEKSLNRWFLGASSPLLQRLLLGAVRGDGSFCKAVAKGYYTSSVMLRDQICEIALKLGIPVTVSNIPLRKLYHDKSRYGRQMYAIRFARKFVNLKISSANLEGYSGAVFCLNTGTSNFLAFRNRRFFFTGNCPYPSLGNKHIVARAERDPMWYKAETAKHLLQTCGRICRSVDDHGETFVLDSDVGKVLRETRDFLPRWFKAAIFTASGEPFFVDDGT